MWRTGKLGDICHISIGKTPSRSNRSYWDEEKTTNNVWLSIADLTALDGRYISDSKEYLSDEGAKLFKTVPKDTLIMSFKLSIGKLAFTAIELRTNEAIAAIQIQNENELDKNYLYHFLSHLDWDRIAGDDVKVKGKTLNKAKLKNLLISFPPLAEQQRIVEKLDRAFAEIDGAIEGVEANAKNTDALFQSYMSKTFAECESLYSLSQLNSICDLQNGYAFKSADYIEYSETLNIRMSSIRPSGFFDAEHNKRYLPDTYAEKYKEFLLKEGDLVIAMTDMADDPKILGVPTIVKDLTGRKFLMNQRVGKLHKFSDSIHIPYLRYFLTSPKIKVFYKNKGDGGLQINISKKDILSAEIPLPPLSIQEKIGKEMSYVQFHSEIAKDRYYMKINEYIALKQSILKQALQPPQQ